MCMSSVTGRSSHSRKRYSSCPIPARLPITEAAQAMKEAAMENKEKLKMEKRMTLGSLFDGSGSFPLSGMLAGIEPVWSSEIEPYPIRVTTKRLPQV